MKLSISYENVRDLKPYENNAKIHTGEQIEQIAESIRQFGMNDPIAVWKNGEIIEGHGRLEACKRLGIDRVPVVHLDALTDEERRAYMNVHNRLTMNTGFNFDVLTEELDSIESIDMEKFGFNTNKIQHAEFFSREDRDYDEHEEDNEEYNDFVDKFKPKKTTDDCYTPEPVYDAICEWVEKEYGVSRKRFVRPFYPNGDYQKEDYPDDCVVVDNPPFSILAEIIGWYCTHGVRFFLFAPSLTLFSARNYDVNYIACNCAITYENGAIVDTGFITNMDKYLIRTAPDLYALIKEADSVYRQEIAKPPALKYDYPPYVITSAMLGSMATYGVDFRIERSQAQRISQLDAMKEFDKAIYGGGYLLSERAKADAERAKADAERAKALERAKVLEKEHAGASIDIDEKTGSIVWRLSDREKEIVRSLG